MKFSIRQMLASAAGAVVAASIASFFGVKGTIIGVAIGSAAATFGTALAAHSLERTHDAVRQAVVRAPDASLLRRLGGTMAAGAVTGTAPRSDTPVTEVATSNEARVDDSAAAETSTMEPATALTPAIASSGPPTAVLADAVATEGAPRTRNWPLLVGMVVAVFLLALVIVTVVELIAGRPLSDLFNGKAQGGGTSVQKVFGSSNKTHTTTPTTTTTVPATSTPTTRAGSTTTSSSPTTTTTSGPTTTTTFSTTTTSSGSTTTTASP